MKLSDITINQKDITRLYHTAWPGSFVHEQEGRFDYLDCQAEDITDKPNNGVDNYRDDIHMVWTDPDNYFPALIIQNYYRSKGRNAYVLWDNGEFSGYCVWIGAKQ